MNARTPDHEQPAGRDRALDPQVADVLQSELVLTRVFRLPPWRDPANDNRRTS